MKEFLSF